MSGINFGTFRAALPALLNAAKSFVPGAAQVEGLFEAGKALVELVPQIVSTFKPHEQETLKADIAALADDNDEGHTDLQRRLAEAAKG